MHVERDLSAPVERVFSYLAEHENLGDLFGAKVRRLNDGETERNGVGSRRELKVGPLPAFEETVTEVVANELIEYKITKGSPLRDHVGVMRFSPTAAGGTHLDYRIRVAMGVPGAAALVKAILTRNIERGLDTVDAKA